MDQKPITIERKDISVETQTLNGNVSTRKDNQPLTTDNFQNNDIDISSSYTKKQSPQTIQQYEVKITIMAQTINKLTKKNQQQKQQFILLNEKLNKAFAKLTPNKLKLNNQNSSQSSQQLQKTKKQLEIQMRKNKLLKKELQTLKQTQKLLNDQDKLIQLKNDLVDKQRQIKQLKQKLKGYQRAEQSQKKMTHYRKEQQMNKKLNQLNQQNIFLKKKMTQLKTKLQQTQKQKFIQKAQQNIQKSIARQTIKKPNSQNMVKKQVHQEEIKKLQDQIKILQNFKISAQKLHKQEIQTLKKQNIILHQQIDELKQEIRRKNKQRYLIQQRNHIAQIRKSKLIQNQTSKTIDHNQSLITEISQNDDKNIRSRTISISRKKDNGVFQSLRKQFLGLSYGNFGNPYKKHDDTLKIQISKGTFTIASLKFIYFQEHIVSLFVTYKFINGEILEIQTFTVEHSYSNTKTTELIFQQHEYIKQVDIFCSKMVQFIQIKTSRDQVLQVGNQKSQFKSKKYSFDIRKNQKTVAFAAITETKIINQVKKQCLISLGLITKKKDVLINKKRVISSLKQPNTTPDQNQIQTKSNYLVKQAISLEKINQIPKIKLANQNEHDKKLNKSK